MKATVSSVIV